MRGVCILVVVGILAVAGTFQSLVDLSPDLAADIIPGATLDEAPPAPEPCFITAPIVPHQIVASVHAPPSRGREHATSVFRPPRAPAVR